MFQILITSAGSLPSQICLTLQFPTDDDLWLRNKTIHEGGPATGRDVSSGSSPQRAAEICWRRIVKFLGARFVVPYFMKSNPGGSSCCPSVCRALHTLHFPSIYLNLFSPTVGWVSVFWDVCVHRISDVHPQTVKFFFAEKFKNQPFSWGIFAYINYSKFVFAFLAQDRSIWTGFVIHIWCWK